MWGQQPPSICLQSHTFTHFTHSNLVGRSMVVGHILVVHTCYLMCTNHIDMTAYTPAFLTELGTTCIYVECSTAGHSHVSHLWSNAGRMVTHPCINQAYDCHVIFFRIIRNNNGYHTNSNLYEISLHIFSNSSYPSVIFTNNKVVTMCLLT